MRNIVSLTVNKSGAAYSVKVTYADGTVEQFTASDVKQAARRATGSGETILGSWWTQTESGLDLMRIVLSSAASLKMQWDAEVESIVNAQESGVPIPDVGVTKNRIVEVAAVHDAFQKFLDTEIEPVPGWKLKPRDVLMRRGDPYVKPVTEEV